MMAKASSTTSKPAAGFEASTAETTAPETDQVVPQQPAAATAAPPAAGTTSERATAMRATLGARRDAESLLAEASALRRTAANDADSMVAEAETLAEQLTSEAGQGAEKTTVEANERADAILAHARAEAVESTLRARAEAEEVVARAKAEAAELTANTDAERDTMRAEITVEVERANRADSEDLHARSDTLLRQVELDVHGLGPALEGAMSVVADAIGSLEKLRAVTPGEAPDVAELPRAPEAAGAPATMAPIRDGEQAPATSAEPLRADAATSAELARGVGVGELATVGPGAGTPERVSTPQGDDAGARPLGWLFRASQS